MRNEYSDTLIEAYDDAKLTDLNGFLNEAASLIVANGGKMTYDRMKNVFFDRMDYAEFRLWSFFAAAIAKHIPIGASGGLRDRPAAGSDRAALTFLYTRVDEDMMIEYSKTEQAKEAGLPALKRHDPNDDGTFHAGVGSRLADFEAIDEPSLIFEMKAGRSPSSYHDATDLIRPTISGPGYSCYKLSNPGQAILENVSIRLSGFAPLNREYSEYSRLLPADRALIYGDAERTMAALDAILASKGFAWRK